MKKQFKQRWSTMLTIAATITKIQNKPPHVNAPLFRHLMIQFYQEKI